jgi:hypothetical protein
MTHAATRRRGGRAWILPVIALLALWVAVLGGWLSRSLVADFLSWWPIWLLLFGVGVLLRGRKIGNVRLEGLIPLVSVVALGLFLFAHVQGWSVLPSSAGEVVGQTDTGVSVAAISARIGEGDIRIDSGQPGALYRSGPLRGGGEIGLPEASERSQGDEVSVELSPLEDPGWYRFNGWSVALSPLPEWGITLQGLIDGDLTGLRIDNLQLEGSGTVSLGSVDTGTPVSIDGNFHIVVPDGHPVRVVGAAEVPDDWNRDENGILSPAEGSGWIISVATGSVVRITEQ